jgi:hypothetical protein
VAASVWLLEHAQDLVSVVVGMVLIVLAGAELVSGVVSFFADMKKISIEPAGIGRDDLRIRRRAAGRDLV